MSSSGEEESGTSEEGSGETEEESSGEEIDVDEEEESNSESSEEEGSSGEDEDESSGEEIEVDDGEEKSENGLSELGRAVHKCVEESQLNKLYNLLLHGPKVFMNEGSDFEIDDTEWGKKKKIVLYQDIDIDEVDQSSEDRTALHKAVEIGNAEIVQLLLKCGADPNARFGKTHETALHLGVRVDTISKVKCFHQLLRNGGNFGLKNSEDRTPIELSVILGCEDCTRLMLEYGGDVSVQYSRKLLKEVKKVANIENVDDWNYDLFGFRIKDEPGELVLKTRAFQVKKASSRTRKWEKMFLSTDKISGVMIHKKLKSRIRKGVPNSIRGKVWSRLLPFRELIIENEGLYYKLVKKSSTFKITRQIDVDINRTFREHRLFKKRYGYKQISLYNVLKAYANYDLEVGYCQGMSGIVALLLMYMDDEEEVFWFLVILMKDPKYDLQYIFLDGFPKLMESFYIHEEVLAKKMKKLSQHFKSQNLHTSMYATKWYMCMIPFDSAVRIWEIYFSEGKKVIYSFIFSLLKILKPQLINQPFEKVLPFLQKLDGFDVDTEKLVLMATKKKIKRRVLDSFAKKYEIELGKGFRRQNVLL